jgi:spermidine synthase
VQQLRLFVIVFISGASVLGLEILGTRILGPYYGVSLFLWSALITVTLAALSLGYAVGGQWADRGPTLSRLGTILAVAGVWILLIPVLTHPALLLVERFGLRAAVLTTATVLFAPPLLLMGMVSPYAIRLKAQTLDRVGRTAGNLYAVSTLASVVAALLMGFYLIPSVGVLRLTLGIGVVMLLASALAFTGGRRGSATGLTVTLLLAALSSAAMARWSGEETDGQRGLIHVEQSPYAEIRILDADGARHLLIDGGIHSIVDLPTFRSRHPYGAAISVAKHFFDEPGDMLLVGMGGGSIARYFAERGWRVDAVEIDKAVGRVARRYFHIKDEHARVHYMDGRRYLEKADQSWDLIVVDVYGSSSIPFHLVTTEAFELMRSHLTGNGVLAINVITEGWFDPLLGAITASLRPHFDHILALPTAEPRTALGNVVLMAANRPLTFDEYTALLRPSEYLDDAYRHWWILQTNHAWDNRFEPDAHDAKPLTDDLNPVDVLSEHINLASRKDYHDYFSSVRDLLW